MEEGEEPAEEQAEEGAKPRRSLRDAQTAIIRIQAAARGYILRRSIAALNLGGMMRALRWANTTKAGIFGQQAIAHARKAGIVLERRASKIGDTAYHLQGNSEYYSAANLRKRWAIKHSPVVLNEVRLLWKYIAGDESMTELPRKLYRRFYKGAYKLLLGEDAYVREQFVRTFDSEWESDVGPGRFEISYSSFFRAVFEIADMWCDSLEAPEYAAFLHDLTQMPDADSEDEAAGAPSGTGFFGKQPPRRIVPWKGGGAGGWKQMEYVASWNEAGGGSRSRRTSDARSSRRSSRPGSAKSAASARSEGGRSAGGRAARGATRSSRVDAAELSRAAGAAAHGAGAAGGEHGAADVDGSPAITLNTNVGIHARVGGVGAGAAAAGGADGRGGADGAAALASDGASGAGAGALRPPAGAECGGGGGAEAGLLSGASSELTDPDDLYDDEQPTRFRFPPQSSLLVKGGGTFVGSDVTDWRSRVVFAHEAAPPGAVHVERHDPRSLAAKATALQLLRRKQLQEQHEREDQYRRELHAAMAAAAAAGGGTGSPPRGRTHLLPSRGAKQLTAGSGASAREVAQLAPPVAFPLLGSATAPADGAPPPPPPAAESAYWIRRAGEGMGGGAPGEGSRVRTLAEALHATAKAVHKADRFVAPSVRRKSAALAAAELILPGNVAALRMNSSMAAAEAARRAEAEARRLIEAEAEAEHEPGLSDGEEERRAAPPAAAPPPKPPKPPRPPPPARAAAPAAARQRGRGSAGGSRGSSRGGGGGGSRAATPADARRRGSGGGGGGGGGGSRAATPASAYRPVDSTLCAQLLGQVLEYRRLFEEACSLLARARRALHEAGVRRAHERTVPELIARIEAVSTLPHGRPRPRPFAGTKPRAATGRPAAPAAPTSGAPKRTLERVGARWREAGLSDLEIPAVMAQAIEVHDFVVRFVQLGRRPDESELPDRGDGLAHELELGRSPRGRGARLSAAAAQPAAGAPAIEPPGGPWAIPQVTADTSPTGAEAAGAHAPATAPPASHPPPLLAPAPAAPAAEPSAAPAEAAAAAAGAASAAAAAAAAAAGAAVARSSRDVSPTRSVAPLEPALPLARSASKPSPPSPTEPAEGLIGGRVTLPALVAPPGPKSSGGWTMGLRADERYLTADARSARAALAHARVSPTKPRRGRSPPSSPPPPPPITLDEEPRATSPLAELSTPAPSSRALSPQSSTRARSPLHTVTMHFSADADQHMDVLQRPMYGPGSSAGMALSPQGDMSLWEQLSSELFDALTPVTGVAPHGAPMQPWSPPSAARAGRAERLGGYSGYGGFFEPPSARDMAHDSPPTLLEQQRAGLALPQPRRMRIRGPKRPPMLMLPAPSRPI